MKCTTCIQGKGEQSRAKILGMMNRVNSFSLPCDIYIKQSYSPWSRFGYIHTKRTYLEQVSNQVLESKCLGSKNKLHSAVSQGIPGRNQRGFLLQLGYTLSLGKESMMNPRKIRIFSCLFPKEVPKPLHEIIFHLSNNH